MSNQNALALQAQSPMQGLPTLFHSMNDYMQLSSMLARSQFVPKDFRGNEGDVLAAVLYGRSLGLDPMQALQCIAVVNGRPSIYGDAALALVRGSGIPMTIKETIEGEGDRMVAVCKVTRGKEEFEARFSVDDAKKAQLWGKTGPWSQYPRRMLGWRARGFVLRDAFPDVLKGLITQEEARDYPQEPINITPRQERPINANPIERVPMSGKYAVVDEDGVILASNDRVSALLPVLAELQWTAALAEANRDVVLAALDAAENAAKDNKTARVQALLQQAREVAAARHAALHDGDDDNAEGMIDEPELEMA